MRIKSFNIQKYINKLKVAKAPVYVIGQENGLALKNVKHPAFNDTENFAKELQISEFYGNMKEGHLYFSDEYKNLLFSLKEIDSNYSQSKTIEDKVQLARNGISQWTKFVEHTSTILPEEEFNVREGTLIKLEDIWMRFKVRNNYLII